MEYDEMTDEEIQQLKKKYEIMKENAYTLAKRIDKAIEYIENLIVRDYKTREILSGIHKNSVDTLLNILKGEDKE